MYAEALFRVSGMKNGKREVITLCYKEEEAYEAADAAAETGWMFVECNILRFVRQPI